jgi:hypothetical protein
MSAPCGAKDVAHPVQDITIRWVIEYSEKADFSNLPPLNINSELFDKTAFIYSGGQDIEEDMVISRGVVKGGRFVYTKLTPDDEFSFPRGETRVLENGVKYYFKNYKVRDGCISNDWVASGGGVRITERYPTEVLTRPPFLEVFRCLAVCRVCCAVFCFFMSCLLLHAEQGVRATHAWQSASNGKAPGLTRFRLRRRPGSRQQCATCDMWP